MSNIQKKIKKRLRGFFQDPNKCWLWDGSKAGNGYGVLSFYKRQYYSHRASYRLFFGPIPNGMCVLHSCDNPACWNPNHLSLGTQKENVHDMIRKNRSKQGGAKGMRNSKCKFSDDTVKKIRIDFENGLTSRDLRAAYGISAAQLYRITRYQARIL